MNDLDLAAISSLLDTAGARLAQRQTDPDADVAITDAYAALLAARFELAPYLTVMPTPSLDEGALTEPAAVADDLAAAWTALRDHALASHEDEALACTRAATYVDDARRHLLSSTS
jgi:hypothetical protein